MDQAVFVELKWPFVWRRKSLVLSCRFQHHVLLPAGWEEVEVWLMVRRQSLAGRRGSELAFVFEAVFHHRPLSLWSESAPGFCQPVPLTKGFSSTAKVHVDDWLLTHAKLPGFFMITIHDVRPGFFPVERLGRFQRIASINK
jgi:hypothetical protein